MLQGLEDMLVHLTDAADRAHSSNRFVQGLKLRSKKSTKARAFCRRCALGRENSPTNRVAEGSTPTEPRGQLRIAVQGARRVDSSGSGSICLRPERCSIMNCCWPLSIAAAGTWRISV
jgi:hypothetical protein